MQAEIGRVLAVLEELYDDIGLLIRIPVNSDRVLDDSSDATDLLKQHLDVEAAVVDSLTFRREDQKSVHSDDVTVRFDAAKRSMRELLSRVRARGGDFPGLLPPSGLSAGGGIGESLSCFQSVVKSLLQWKKEKLLMSAEEAQSREDELRDTMARQKQAGGDLRALQKERNAETAERKKMDADFGSESKKLTESIRNVKKVGENDVASFRASLQTQAEAEKSRHETAVRTLQEKIEKLTSDVSKLREKNEGVEAASRKRNLKINQDVEAWIARYDKDMEEKTRELSELGAQISKDQVRLDYLQAELAAFDKERETRESAERELTAVLQTFLSFEIRRHEAATRIQAIARGFITRLRLKGGGKSRSKTPEKTKKKKSKG